MQRQESHNPCGYAQCDSRASFKYEDESRTGILYEKYFCRRHVQIVVERTLDDHTSIRIGVRRLH